MSLVTTIAEAKAYLRLPHVSENASLPNIGRVEKRFIVPILGQALFNTLSGFTPNAGLLALVKAAIVPLAYYNDLAWSHAAITDAGVRVQQSENMPTASRWSYMELKEALHNESMEALNDLWQYLYDNATVLSWTDPSISGVVFKTSTEFSKYFSICQPARVFNSLKPIIAEVEDHFLYPVAGEAFVLALVALASPTAADKKALKLMRNAVAMFTINRACSKLPVQVGGNGLTVLLSAPDQPTNGQVNAPQSQLQKLEQITENEAQRHLKQLTDYLQATASETVFIPFFESDLYVAPSTEEASNENSRRKGVFAL